MTPVRINFLVEGQTEETFVREILAEHFAYHGTVVSVRRIETGRRHSVVHRGGTTTFPKAHRDIQRWLAEDRSAFLTTMFDLYRLPNDVPGVDQLRRLRNPYRKVQVVEDALAGAIGDRRFIPYIQLHEFEGLLFSGVAIIDQTMLIVSTDSRLRELQAIRANFNSPEEIDDGDTTAPSKRLIAIYPAYDKAAFGFLIAKRIGLTIIRNQCHHFGDWLSRLEALRD